MTLAQERFGVDATIVRVLLAALEERGTATVRLADLADRARYLRQTIEARIAKGQAFTEAACRAGIAVRLIPKTGVEVQRTASPADCKPPKRAKLRKQRHGATGVTREAPAHSLPSSLMAVATLAVR